MATLRSLLGLSLTANLQRNYLWEVTMPALDPRGNARAQQASSASIATALLPGVQGIRLDPGSESSKYQTPQTAEEVSIRCATVGVGDYRFDVQPYRIGPVHLKFAGLGTIDVLRLTFRENEVGIVRGYFNEWLNQMVNGDGLYSEKNHYSRTISIQLLNVRGQRELRLDCRGCFPLGKPRFDLSFSEDNYVIHRIDFAVDRIDHQEAEGFRLFRAQGIL